jgi:hypothetical protein
MKPGNVSDFRDAVHVTYRLHKEIVLDEGTESAHSMPTFGPKSRLGGKINAQITTGYRPFSDRFGDPSPESSFARYLLRDMHRCRPVSCLQELQILQALREGRR